VPPNWKGALLVLVAAAIPRAIADDGIALEPRIVGDCTARLNVRIADPSERAPIPVTLTVTVEGPSTLEVAGLHLQDPVGAWDAVLQPADVIGTERKSWQQIARLQVKKQGAWPLPSVSVRFRPSPQAEWQSAEWTDLFSKARPGPSPEPLPPLPVDRTPRNALLGAVLIVLGIGVLVLVLRWRRRKPAPLGPRPQALRNLAAVSVAAADFHDQLAGVLRTFLAARFGLPAATRSTTELLTAITSLPDFPAAQQVRIRDLLEACDAARFGGRAGDTEAAQTLLDNTRQFIEQTP
jgi:hypothetical protein